MKKKQKNEIKNQLTKEIKIVIGSLIGLAIIASGVYFALNSKTSNSKTSAAQTTNLMTASANLTRDFNYKKGPESAKVKIVEFYDPECEACGAFFPFIKEALSRHGNNIQLITRYAIYHGNSLLAAKATDAAGLQGKYWEYQELLFVNQQEWSHKQEPATSYFVKYAQSLKLDTKRFLADMEDLRRMDTISQDIEDGKNLGVNGTPTIFINGKMLERIHPQTFSERIAEELQKN